MFKRISVVTLLTVTLLLSGFVSNAHAAANQVAQVSYKANIQYSSHGQWETVNQLLNRLFKNWGQFNWQPVTQEQPKVEQPKPEAPKQEAPKVEQPKVEQPKPEAPKQEAPKVEQPKVEQPKQEVPKQEAPKVQQPIEKRPAPQAPKQEQTKQPSEAYQLNEYEQQVVELTNNERAQHGLSPLKADWELSRVARDKSQDLKVNNYFAHNSPTYGSPFDMMKAYGISYRTAGENIARGQRTPQEVVNAWMNSPGHRANILNGNFTHIGVGFIEQGNYWTQMFIGR